MLMIIGSANSLSQDISLPEPKGISNTGTEFWITLPPPLYDEQHTTENEIRIIVISHHRTSATLETGYSKITKHIVPYEATVFNIKPDEILVYNKSGFSAEAKDFVSPSRAFRLVSKSPVSVYVQVRFNISSEGYLALPTSSLGKSYTLSSYNDPTVYYSYYNSLPGITCIIAPFDNTAVKFTLGGSDNSITAAGVKSGESRIEKLNKGDIWVISTGSDGSDLSGSRIEANNPVAVITGNQCANIPINTQSCNYLVEQEIPDDCLGKSYHLWSSSDRKYSSIARIYASEPNTNVYRDGVFISNLSLQSGKIGEGFIETRITSDNINGISTITADKPIKVSLYNTGSFEEGDPKPTGDPFQISITPIEQYQNAMNIFFPESDNPDSPINRYLVLIHRIDDYDNIEGKIEYSKVYDGPPDWKSIKVFDKSSYKAPFNYSINQVKYGMMIIPWTGSGVYNLRSDYPCTAYIYSSTRNASFGFPASTLLNNQKYLDKSPPVPVYIMNCNGSVDGYVEDKPDDQNIRSGLSILTFYEDLSYNYNFESEPFLPENSSRTGWKLKIINPAEDARGVIKFSDDAGNDSVLVIDYFTPRIEISPDKIDMGQFVKGEKRDTIIKLINRSNGPKIFTKANFRLGNIGFEFINPDFPFEIAPGESKELRIGFKASIDGSFIDSAGVGDDCIIAYKSQLTAQTVGPEIIVNDIQFGDRIIGITVTDTIKIKNSGKSDLIITDFTPPSHSEFTIRFPIGITISPVAPLTISPGENPVELYLDFLPKSKQEIHDKIVFQSNALRSDSICLINGRGMNPGLLASSIDFGRKRIHRDRFPAGPYYLESGSPGIIIENASQADIFIENFKVESGINSEAFEYDSKDIIGKLVPANQSIVVPVSFRPINPGIHELVLSFNTNDDNSTKSVIKGIGIVPKMRIESIQFDTTVIDDIGSISEKRFRIVNLSREEWEYADSLTLNGFESPGNLISLDWSDWGSLGFKADLGSIFLPKILHPGEYIEFATAFLAVTDSLSEALLYTDSDADTSRQIKFSGYGLSHSLQFFGDKASICPTEETLLSGTLNNIGSGIIEIKSLRMEPQDANFAFLDQSLTKGFILEPRQSKRVEIKFTPNEPMSKVINIKAETDSELLPEVSTEIIGNSVLNLGYSYISPASIILSIGDISTFSILLDTPTDRFNTEIDKLEVHLSFNPQIFNFTSNDLILGDLVSGKFAFDGVPIIDNTNGNAKIKIKSLAGNLIGNGEILKITSQVYLPRESTEITELKHEIKAINNNCVEFIPGNAKISILPICLGDHNQIKISDHRYILGSIMPNPVNTDFISLNYSVGLEGLTTIAIYNSTGERVLDLVNEIKTVGKHSIDVNLFQIPSGTYFCRMQSGPFSKTELFVIFK